jgi:hypothetical protein
MLVMPSKVDFNPVSIGSLASKLFQSWAERKNGVDSIPMIIDRKKILVFSMGKTPKLIISRF